MVQESHPVVIPKDLLVIDHKVVEKWWASMLDLMIERDVELLKLEDGKKPVIMREGIAEYALVHETVNLGKLSIIMTGYLNSTIITRSNALVRRGTRQYKEHQFVVSVEPEDTYALKSAKITIFRLVNPIQHWTEEQSRMEDIAHRAHTEIIRELYVEPQEVEEEEAIAVYLKSDEIRFIRSILVEASERDKGEGDYVMKPRDKALVREILKQLSGRVG